MKSFHFLCSMGMVCWIGSLSAFGITKARQENYTNIGLDTPSQKTLTPDEARAAGTSLRNAFNEVGNAGRPASSCVHVPDWQRSLVLHQTIGNNPAAFNWGILRHSFNRAVMAGAHMKFATSGAICRSSLPHQVENKKASSRNGIVSDMGEAAAPVRPLRGTFREPNVSLEEYPTDAQVNHHSGDHEITFGDLHGNAIQLIYSLIREGILRIKESETKYFDPRKAIYKQLKQIYEEGKVSNRSIRTFEGLLQKFEVVPNGPKIRFLGDDVGKLGRNDIFTLLVMKKLHNEKAPFEILASSLEFVRFCEQDLPRGKSAKRKLFPIKEHQIPSALSMQDVAQRDPEFAGILKEIYQKIYRPHLKVLSYSKNNSKKMAIYTHAPVGLESIMSLAAAFGLGECENRIHLESSQEVLTQCIDSINSKFSKLRDSGHVSDLFAFEVQWIAEEKEKSASGKIDRSRFGLFHTLWNKDVDLAIRVPELKDGTQVDYAHGYWNPRTTEDQQKNDLSYVSNLNSNLGVNGLSSRGEYTAYHFHHDLIAK